MKVKMVAIEDVVPYARNPRKNMAAISKVSASLKEFGWQQPVVVDKDMVVIAGHTRLEAARTLDMKKVPVQIADKLTDAQVKAYRIADNRVSQEAEWDIDLLKLELSDLDGLDYDLLLTGFDDDELNGMLIEAVEEGLIDENSVPETPETPVTVEGDVWVLSNHRLMCGDSTSIDAVDKLMNGNKVDLVFTDPPYGMFLDTNYDAMFGSDKSHRKTGKRFMEVAGDHDDFKPEFINTIFTAFDYVDEIFIWGADYFSELIPDRKDGSWVVWDKRTNQEMDKVSGNTFELCWSKKKHKRLIARILWSGHHGMQKDDTKKRVHPTQKPVELVKWFFDNWSKPKDSVVDLFGGSGSTLIACEQTNRIAYLMELDEKYVDVIINRWQDFTGKEAVHAETGKTYNEMKAERDGGE